VIISEGNKRTTYRICIFYLITGEKKIQKKKENYKILTINKYSLKKNHQNQYQSVNVCNPLKRIHINHVNNFLFGIVSFREKKTIKIL